MPKRTPEQLAKHREYERRRRAAMTPEQRVAYNEKTRVRMARYYARLSDEKKRERIAADNERRRAARKAERIAAEKVRRAQAAKWKAENRAAFDEDAAAIYARISRAIPAGYPSDIRDDVASDISIALLDGELPINGIEREVRRFISAHFSGREWGRIWSLDAAIPGTDGIRRIDTIAGKLESEQDAAH